MGRKRNVYFRDFFIEENNKLKCKSCGKIVANYITNMKRHLQKDHQELLEKSLKIQKIESENSLKIKFSVEMCKDDVVNECIDLITKESLPLSFFDCNSFNILTSPIFEGLKMQKISSKNIMELVIEKHYKIKKNIIQLLKNKVISLKIDTATRSDRSILGVNVQIILKNEVKIFTLAMLELKKKHTAENLKLEIEKVLSDFDINKRQLYTITTDNGRNLIKAVELLNTNSDSESDSEDGNEFEDVVSEINFDNILSIKCAAHTLQLAVKDFLRDYVANIDKARKMVKTLRSPSFR